MIIKSDKISKNQSCSEEAPYSKIDSGCFSVRECGELQVKNITEFDFSCEPCQVFVTGLNWNGQLGDGTDVKIDGFKSVSTICFEQL